MERSVVFLGKTHYGRAECFVAECHPSIFSGKFGVKYQRGLKRIWTLSVAAVVRY